MIIEIILLAPFIYCLYWNIFDKASHFGYAYQIAKHEGIRRYINALWWSYFLPEKYLVMQGHREYIYDREVLASIEFICRNTLNSVKGFSVTYDEVQSLVLLKNNDNRVLIRFEEAAVFIRLGDNLLLPPYHIRLIELCCKKNEKVIDIEKL